MELSNNWSCCWLPLVPAPPVTELAVVDEASVAEDVVVLFVAADEDEEEDEEIVVPVVELELFVLVILWAVCWPQTGDLSRFKTSMNSSSIWLWLCVFLAEIRA